MSLSFGKRRYLTDDFCPDKGSGKIHVNTQKCLDRSLILEGRHHSGLLLTTIFFSKHRASGNQTSCNNASHEFLFGNIL